ncbi:hypothetical protein SELMODRAFT_444543 [Selaginella moellendorffii]|uniref:START domain-containing protein n=2 Tax=Selaginella moellendorffii TaxID=88036 RepID=D8SB03_SELML|nr:START domain-containing protein 10 [Selaginella moellendorffii]XP_002984560.2 START domain-containing protein 10 [Selaginella moellendorffii]EFJ18311.1 hypothetical protein SELMODRAFT_444543 [Selaginella moellendorffii]|eukprot:XP_002980660.1 START domain-containing protein 10 [Selaginella moellendorffii]
MSVSEESLKRYVEHASYRCYQDLLVDSRADETEGWKPIKSKRGIAISCRRDGNKTIVMRGQSVLNISPSKFQAVTNAIDTAKQWDKSFIEGQCLHRLEDNLNIFRLVFGRNSRSPLFRNREFIVHERREIMDDGTVVVAVTSLPQEMAAGILPPRGQLVRGLLLYSGWVVERIQQSNACMVTYIVQVDPAGWLPKCIANMLVVKLVFVIYHLCRLAAVTLSTHSEEITMK